MIRPTLMDTTLRDRVRARLLEERDGVHWTGHLSASALSTAIACVALQCAHCPGDADAIRTGVGWLTAHQNDDGSWGDTTESLGNLSTTVLVWAALGFAGERGDEHVAAAISHSVKWIEMHAGGMSAEALAKAVEARYGDDRTFAVPIMTLCAICGSLGEDPWRWVRPLPFECAAFPRKAYRFLNLQVVSYALPALISVGLVRFRKRPPRNPIARVVRGLSAGRTLRLLDEIQPASGGFLEAIPLTGFVVMSLIAAGEREHPVVDRGLGFLRRTRRNDGSWPIDVNLSTWVTTGALNALAVGGLDDLDAPSRDGIRDWLLGQQHRVVHPYTGSPPGGFAWTDLPGGVPDADDTAGAVIALHHLDRLNPVVQTAAASGINWLIDLQNRDGGIPTFCRGWGALAFDRSAPDLTAHALMAFACWREALPPEQRLRIERAITGCLSYLRQTQRSDGSWVPLWFGNEDVPGDLNPTYATSRVVHGLLRIAPSGEALTRGVAWLKAQQNPDGGWGGIRGTASSIEETGLALDALVSAGVTGDQVESGIAALRALTDEGANFPAAPIGFYFAKLWYSERLYPLIFSCGACERLAARDRA